MRQTRVFLFTCMLLLYFKGNAQMYEEWQTKFGGKYNSVMYAGNMVIDESQNSYLYIQDKE